MAELESGTVLSLPLHHRLRRASRREERAQRRAHGRSRHENGTVAAPSRLAEREATPEREAAPGPECSGHNATSPTTPPASSAATFKTHTNANAATDADADTYTISNASLFNAADPACAAGSHSGEVSATRSSRSARRERREKRRQRHASRQAPWLAVRFFQEFGVEEMVGEGRYGSVWRCVHRQTGAEVACKQVEKRGGPKWLARELECFSLSQGHPHVLSLSGVFESDKYLYIVTELCEGDLFDYIGSQKSSMPEEHARELFRQLAHAVHHCHARGVLHRDLKPENILLQQCPHTGGVSVKLADFGLSTRLEKGDKTIGWVGSDPYEAPEVLASRPYDFSADVFSLGVVLFGMLSGTWPTFTHKRLFDAEENFSWPGWQGVSPEARRLITRMLSLDPRLRPSMSDVLEDLWFSVPFEDAESEGEGEEGEKREEEEEEERERGAGAREVLLGAEAVDGLCADVARRLRCASADAAGSYAKEAGGPLCDIEVEEGKEEKEEREEREKAEGVGEEDEKEVGLDSSHLTAWRQLASHAALSVPSHDSVHDYLSPSGLPLRCTTCVPERTAPPEGIVAAASPRAWWEELDLPGGETSHTLAFWRRQHLLKEASLLYSPDGSGTERSWCSYGSALSSPSTASEYSPSPTLFANKRVPRQDTKL